MYNITDLDKNFIVEDNAKRNGMVFYNIKQAPFRIYGVFHDGNVYRRLPKSLTEKVSTALENLSTHTSGGRVRFITDSPYVIVKCEIPGVPRFSHMAMTNRSGFDIYVDKGGKQVYERTILPPVTENGGYAGVCDFLDEFLDGGERTVTLNFPLYGGLRELYIGIKEGSVLRAAPDYTIEKPFVYYGSSITQGGCSSRPGTCYQGFISRRYDANYINLGFSGNGFGEPVVAEYIASLDMSAFILDYDYNAPSNEHYKKTHEPFFKTIRAAHPDIPVIFMTRPKHRLSAFELERIEIARKTYENALAAGDKNVVFVDGRELMELAGFEGAVDRTHPTDLGFYSMALRLYPELDKFFKPIL